MRSSAESLRGRFATALLRALAAATALLLAAATWGQDRPMVVPAEWARTLQAATSAVGDPSAATAELELLRDRLLRLRSAALEFESAAQARVAEVTVRLDALGPAPAEGVTEPAEIAERRAQISDELAAAQVPLLEAQDIQRRADAVIRQIDQIVRVRFTDELRSHGPSPLRPRLWIDAAEAIAGQLAAARDQARATLADPASRDILLRRVPIDLVLAAFGIALSFGLRRQLVEWTEVRLAHATSPRSIALLVSLRNFSRLIVPAVGAGLLFAALDPATVIDPAADDPFFNLPGFLLALIGASWVASSVFAPRLPTYRLAPVDDEQAAAGARTMLGLGSVLALHLFLQRYVAGWDLEPGEAAALGFPLILAGGYFLWRLERVLRRVRHTMDLRDRGAPLSERAGALTHGTLDLVRRATWVIAFAAPALAAVGYLAAANYLLYSTILTIGLLATGVVLFDLANKTLGALRERKGEPVRELGADGLAPIAIGAALTIAALPFLALIWGARASDLADIWYLLRDGVTFGGIRISFAMLVTFVIVFGVIYGVTRFLQSLLRTTVLPRTRMDAGGKNAVLAGVGYAGFFIAAIAAVSSTGIDLTSLAFVAGALSVGIGFGLQNIVSNFVSGIILLVERPIKEGDWIEVGGQMGYVRGISVRSTEIETFDRASVILPNSDLVAGTVLNRTHTGMSGRVTVPVGVSYASDPRHVERVLMEIAEDHPMVLIEPAPRVLFMGYGPDSLEFEIRAWLRDVNFSLSARSDINFAIFEQFKKEGISIPFPQRVVEIKNPDALGAAFRPEASETVEAAGHPQETDDEPSTPPAAKARRT